MSTISVLAPARRPVNSPFRGFPTTRVTIDPNGATRIAVHACALTPLRARLSLYAGGATGTVLLFAGTYGLIVDGAFALAEFGKLALVSVGAFPATWWGLRYLVRKAATVTFTAEHIHVRRTFRARRFERAHPHGFVLLPHDKADKERDRHAFLDRKRPPKWWSWNRRKYYADSFHVVLHCFGERHDILTVYGRKKAEKIHARLQACDAVMDGRDFGDSGVSLTPDADWGVEAGGL